MKFRLSILSLFFILNISLLAQVEVKGKVTDLKGEPLQASVTVKSSKEEIQTAKDGTFTVQCKSRDKIKVTANDFKTTSIRIKGSSKFLEIKLKKSGIDYTQFANFKDIISQMYGGLVSVSNSKIFISQTEGRNAASGEALLMLDGREVSFRELNALPTTYFKAIKVLRHKAELVQYGQKGAAGVVVIKTKEKK